MDSILEDNLSALRQGVALLGSMKDESYARTCPACFGSSVGGHIRHNIDHYLSFLRGRIAGRIDYDDRRRDELLQTSACKAADTLREICGDLEALPDAELDEPKRVRMDCGSSEKSWSDSTARRELQFLLSHTIHHYALISVICGQLGIETPENFGVAPSTLKHQRNREACAH